MADFSTILQTLSKDNQEPSWLKESRASALARYEKAVTPQRIDEDWRRTDVSKFLVSDLSVESVQPKVSMEPKVRIPATASTKGGALFTGLATDSSSANPAANGIVFTSLLEAAKSHPDLVQKCLAYDIPSEDVRSESGVGSRSKFDHLSNALWNNSVFLYVPANVMATLPLSALLHASGKDQFQKILIVIDRGASADFWLDQTSSDARWISSVCDVFIKEGARLSFLNIQRHSAQANLLSTFNAVVEKDAVLDLMTVEAGSALAKENWNVHLVGENASAKAFGLVRAAGKQHFDETLYVGHLKPRTQSEVLFKTVAADESRSIFSGLIHVHKIAQKTQAYQTNRNLLLSRKARTDTIPKLEILADDVKCGHGAAVSSIDEEQIYYLMSRGMSREVAKAVIVEGFYADVLLRFFKEDSIRGPEGDKLHEEVAQSVRDILVGKSALEAAAL